MKSQIDQFIILLILLVTISCKNQEIDALEEYIIKIDDIPVSESLYVFEVDSDKNIIDTLALRKLKYDTKNNLVFENNFQLGQRLETVNYYNSKNEMVYSEIKRDDEVISDFRVNIENGLIVSANYNIYENEVKDSVFMKYDYTFDKGKKKKLLIDSGDDFNTIELYNQLEKPILNISIHKKDTLEKTEFVYDKDNVIKKKEVKNFSRNEEVVYIYDNGFIVRESFLKNGVEKFYTDYYKDKAGNYLRHTIMIKDSI